MHANLINTVAAEAQMPPGRRPLAEKGLIARIASSSDRRSKLLTLLQEGERVLDLADPLVQRSQQSLVQCLEASEVNQLTSLLAKVVDNMGNISRTGR